MRTTQSLLNLCVLLFCLSSISIFTISAYSVSVLHNFTSSSSGSYPGAPLIQASDGNLYGVTTSGGAADFGTVFQINTTGNFNILHNFTGSQGSNPVAALIQANDGYLYGTTSPGGSIFGTVFQISTSGNFTLVHSFTGPDGSDPRGALIQDYTDLKLYGTTFQGGSANIGTVFEITTSGAFTILHNFTGLSFDGSGPYSGLIQATDTDLYGTTLHGGSSNSGTVFRISTSGSFSLLYSFSNSGSNAFYPQAGLVQAVNGNLYGTTNSGGSTGIGTIFQITTLGILTILHNFTGSSVDGVIPQASLIQVSDGNLYGTTEQGGSASQGIVFQISTTGSNFSLLHSFTSGPLDGSLPTAGLIQARDRKLYGTTVNGGSSGLGTVFSLDKVIAIDYCLYNPCLNGAGCVNNVSVSLGYSCNCSAGYIGSQCEEILNNCLSSPCPVGIPCVNQIGIGTYQCGCSSDVWLTRCNIWNQGSRIAQSNVPFVGSQILSMYPSQDSLVYFQNFNLVLFNFSTYTSVVVAGCSSSGLIDGSSTAACFAHPTCIKYDAINNFYYVADAGYVRRISIASNWTVTTLWYAYAVALETIPSMSLILISGDTVVCYYNLSSSTPSVRYCVIGGYTGPSDVVWDNQRNVFYIGLYSIIAEGALPNYTGYTEINSEGYGGGYYQFTLLMHNPHRYLFYGNGYLDEWFQLDLKYTPFKSYGVGSIGGIQGVAANNKASLSFILGPNSIQMIVLNPCFNTIGENPCLNGGSCVISTAAIATGYKCNCLTGYTGSACETIINNCLSNSKCQNGGACVNVIGNGTFSCNCTSTTTTPSRYFGTFCDIQCLYNETYSNGKCGCGSSTNAANMSVGTSSNCAYCGNNCYPTPFINQIANCTGGNSSFIAANSTGKPGNCSYSCQSGYTQCGSIIQPCNYLIANYQTDLNNCGGCGKKCNSTGSFACQSGNCQCQAGYIGSTCGTIVDNCATIPCKQNGICTNVIGNGTFLCNCNNTGGYSGSTCEIISRNYNFSSFNGHCYALSRTTTDCDSVELEAKTIGGHLVAITSVNEQNFINSVYLTGANQRTIYWIGLMRNESIANCTRPDVIYRGNECWYWRNGEELNTTQFINWDFASPDNHFGLQNRVFINFLTEEGYGLAYLGQWNDDWSTDTNHLSQGIIEIAPCSNGEMCQSNSNNSLGWSCSCPIGYSGLNCEIPLQKCGFIDLNYGTSSCSIANQYPVGTICNLNCASQLGYALNGPSILQCLSTGNWNYTSEFTQSSCIQTRHPPQLVSVLPSITIPASTGATITITGTNLDSIVGLSFNAVPVIKNYSASTADELIVSVLPNNTTGFVTITIRLLNQNITCSASPVAGEYVDPACLPSNEIPYFSTALVISGQFCASSLNSSCQNCPQNAVCPGGNILIPNTGYYTPNSNIPSVYSCDDPTLEKCSGGRPGAAACFLPYSNTLCASCSAGFYSLNNVCIPCVGGALETSVITILVFGYFAFVGICLIFCSDKWLEQATIVILLCETLLSAGDGVYLYMGPRMRSVYNYLRIFKLDFSYLHTDCTGNNSLVSYTTRFGISVLVLFALWVWFSFMALIYQYRRQKLYIRRSNQNAFGVPINGKQWQPWEWFKNPARPRLMRAFIFLVVIVYQQFNGLMLTILYCRHYSVYEIANDGTGTNTFRMVFEKETICYKSSHLAAAIFCWIFILLFSITLPIYLLVKLYHGYRNKLLDNKEFKKKFGFMYRRIRHQYYFYRSINWIFCFISACQISLLPNDVFVQVPVLLGMATVESLLLYLLQPMLTKIEHTNPYIIIALKFLGCGLLFLSVKQNMAGSLLIAISVLGLIYLGYLYRKWTRRSREFEIKQQIASRASLVPGRLGSIIEPNINRNKAYRDDEEEDAEAIELPPILPAKPLIKKLPSDGTIVINKGEMNDEQKVLAVPAYTNSISYIQPSISHVDFHIESSSGRISGRSYK